MVWGTLQSIISLFTQILFSFKLILQLSKLSSHSCCKVRVTLFYGGKLGCFSPVTYLSRKEITVIRPLILCEEREIRGAARRLELPVVKSNCPVDGVTARKDTEELVKNLEKQFPHLRTKVLGAMQRAGLDGW